MNTTFFIFVAHEATAFCATVSVPHIWIMSGLISWIVSDIWCNIFGEGLIPKDISGIFKQYAFSPSSDVLCITLPSLTFFEKQRKDNSISSRLISSYIVWIHPPLVPAFCIFKILAAGPSGDAVTHNTLIFPILFPHLFKYYSLYHYSESLP